ncbi:MAG: PucR family transcriptional regulator, partial [Defluviitaleaceae bacterium]|nr:PucR family transcriptional regulator [Defluviitaleaceae bacterium]
LAEAGASCLGIKKERFIKKIPANVIETANSLCFPIVEIPPLFVWSDILACFYETRFEIEKNSGQNAEFLPKQMFSAGSENCKGKSKKENDYLYGVLLIHSDSPTAVYGRVCEAAKTARLAKLATASCRYSRGQTDGEAYVLIGLCMKNTGESHEIWQNILSEELECFLRETPVGFVSMGRFYAGAEKMQESCKEARDAFTLGKLLWDDKKCFLFSMVSVYDILRRANPSRIDLHYMQLLDSSKSGLNFDGIRTLEILLERGSYKKAAADLYIHENTLRYRVQKIGDILNLDMENPVITHALLTQIKLWKLCKY